MCPEEPDPQEGPQLERLRREILAFLLQRPRAQDTLEGIATWWLLEQRLEREVQRVERVLERLVADGLVVKRKGADGRARFSADPERVAEIERLVERALP